MISLSQFHSQHTLAMSFIVGPVMIIELAAGAWLIMHKADFFSMTHILCVTALWALTFLVSVPLHNKLAAGYDPQVIKSLITTNWPRTVIWTFKALLTSFWALRMFKL